MKYSPFLFPSLLLSDLCCHFVSIHLKLYDVSFVHVFITLLA